MKEKKQKEPGAEMQEVLTEEQLKKRKLHRARRRCAWKQKKTLD